MRLFAIASLLFAHVLWTANRMPAAVTSPRSQSPIHVGQNVLVSGANPESEHTEYAADADPNDPKRLMVCSMVFSSAHNRLESDLYLTEDGGQQWSRSYADTSHQEIGPDSGAWDPYCAYDAKGGLLFTTLAEGMILHRSHDGGHTWTDSVINDGIDAEHITVDQTGGRFAGRIYINGNSSADNDFHNPLWLLTSTDGGQQFHKSAYGPIPHDSSIDGQGTVLPSGTLLIPGFVTKDPHASDSRPRATLAVTASSDGGAHINAPVEVRSINWCVRQMAAGGWEASGQARPTMAADRSNGPYRGRAYVIYADQFHGHCAVFSSYSDDDGQHWSRAYKVSDEPTWDGSAPGPDVFLPVVAVNSRGVVGVTWYDRREDPRADQASRLRFTASLDGGVTWLVSQPVSTAAFEYPEVPHYPAAAVSYHEGTEKVEETHVWPGPRLSYSWNNGLGDYAGFAASADGRFHAFWIDNRTGVAQMYTATIEVEGTVWQNGAKELASLHRVTPSIQLSCTKSVFDAEARTIKLEFHLRNWSPDAIASPLKMRITKLYSDLGTPKVTLQPSGEILQEGSVIDLTALLPSSGLPPKAWSGSQRLEARFDVLKGTLDSDARREMLWFDTEFFAGAEARPPNPDGK